MSGKSESYSTLVNGAWHAQAPDRGKPYIEVVAEEHPPEKALHVFIAAGNTFAKDRDRFRLRIVRTEFRAICVEGCFQTIHGQISRGHFIPEYPGFSRHRAD